MAGAEAFVETVGMQEVESLANRAVSPSGHHAECHNSTRSWEFRLAVLVYRMLCWGQHYVHRCAAAYEARRRWRILAHLNTTARDLG